MKKYILLILVLCATQGHAQSHAFDIGIQPQEEGFEAQERDEPQNFSEEIQAIERKIANAMGPILEMRRAQEVEEDRKRVEEARNEARKRMDEFLKNQEEAGKIQEEALKIKEEALNEDRKRIDEFRKKEEEARLKAAAEAEKARLDAEESDASGSVD